MAKQLTLKQLRDKNIVLAKEACKAAVQKEHLIIAAVDTVETIEQTLNHLAKRCRRWYALYNPEAEHEIEDHQALIHAIIEQKERKAKTMGADISNIDQLPIVSLAKKIAQLHKEKESLETYLEKTMQGLAPNLTAIADARVAASLIAHAGSLKRLALLPASTVQVLGAEEAFFRFKQGQGRCPKHGVIIAHPFVNAAKRNNRGKVSRALAAAISKCARVDYFGGDEYYGYQEREKLEKKIKQNCRKAMSNTRSTKHNTRRRKD
jgi:nucleolar protein 56